MSKAKLYKIDKNNKYIETKNQSILSFLIGIIVYAIVLMITASLFKNIEIANFFYAIIAALILSALNYFVRPILVYLTLPLSIITCGIAYPIVNMIILNLCDIIMGSKFSIHGLFSAFIISIFISLLKIILDRLITNKFRRK